MVLRFRRVRHVLGFRLVVAGLTHRQLSRPLLGLLRLWEHTNLQLRVGCGLSFLVVRFPVTTVLILVCDL